jgi:hypothetical protein
VLKARAETPLTVPMGVTHYVGWPIVRNGQRVDLTGWTVRAQIRPSRNSETVLHELSSAIGNAGTTGGYVVLAWAPEDLDGSWRDAVYDVHATDPLGQVLYVSGGTIHIRRAVTRDVS